MDAQKKMCIRDRGMRVSPSQRVCVGKKEVRQKNEMVLLAVNKPVGIVCTDVYKRQLMM